MAYAAAQVRMAIYRGTPLGTELISIAPSETRLGGTDGTDIDRDFAYISIMSPNMKLTYDVAVYLQGAGGASTPQLGLQRAFIQEMRNMANLGGLKFNDLVWIDDVTKTTQIDLGGGPDQVGEILGPTLNVDSLAALGAGVDDKVWIGSVAANEGFCATVTGTGANQITIDAIPGEVLLGGITQEDARRVGDNYDVYLVSMCYKRCKYKGQALPPVQEGSQDDYRYNMVYQFDSDTLPDFEGAI